MSKAQKEKIKRGDRFDGVWLNKEPAMNQFMAYLYPNRADNEAYINEEIDLRPIEAYLAAADLAPRRDHTNEENTYVRNRIRNELIPYLADNFNPNIIDTLARAAANAREDSAYLKELAAQCFFDAQVAAGEVPVPVGGVPAGAAPLTRICLDRPVVLAAPSAVRHRMLRMAFAALGLVQDIAAVHLAAMDQLIEEGRTSSETNLPGGYLLRIEYDVLVLLPPQKPASQTAGTLPGDVATGAEAGARPGETAAGKYPIESVKMMATICLETERHRNERRMTPARKGIKNVNTTIGSASVIIADNVKAKAIICPTHTGRTARLVAASRPKQPIYAFSSLEPAIRRTNFFWGVKGILAVEQETHADAITNAIAVVRDRKILKKNDLVVVTAGDPETTPYNDTYVCSTNMVMVAQVR